MPIIPPQSQPLVFIFLPNTKQPINIESPFITWFIGIIASLEMLVYLIINANNKMHISANDSFC